MEAKLEKFLEYTSAFNNFGRIDFIRYESVKYAKNQCNLTTPDLSKTTYKFIDSTVSDLCAEIDLNFVSMPTYDQFSRYVFNLQFHLQGIVEKLNDARDRYLKDELMVAESKLNEKYNSHLVSFFDDKVGEWITEIDKIITYGLEKLKDYDRFHSNSVHIPELDSQEKYNTGEKLLIFHYLQGIFIDKNKLPPNVDLAIILGRLFTAKPEYVRQSLGKIWDEDTIVKRLERVKVFFEEVKIYPDLVKEIENDIRKRKT